MKIITIPCLQDNFAYLLICTKTQHAAVVDPSEATPVISEIERQGVKLTTILNTHHVILGCKMTIIRIRMI